MLDVFAKYFAIVFSSLLIRYLFFAGTAFLLFYVFLRKYLRHRKVQPAYPKGADYRREIFYSLLTLAIFTLVGWIAMGPHARSWTRWYFDLHAHSWGYFAFSVLAMIVIHDAYFYWTHRLMHWRPVYRLFHRIHHDSTNPSPWAAFAFHPFEAVIEASIILVVAVLLPVHPFAFVLFLVWMTAFNVYGHLGYELFPRWVTRHPLAKWINTSTNHNLHHKYFRQNYGLYFRWWDVWMKTDHARYQETLTEIQNRPFIAADSRTEWAAHVRKLWMLTPYFAIGIGLLVLKNAWIALAAFHGCMIIALVVHRNDWDFARLWRGGRLLWLAGVTLSVLGFGYWLSRFAGQHPGYGAELGRMMASLGLHGPWLTVFALYFCAANPVIEEAFWRGLFGAGQRRPVLADAAYGCFHFLVLLPFMYASYAAIAALALVGMGYLWRQIANRSQGLALPIAWHALGDAAIIVVVASLLGSA